VKRVGPELKMPNLRSLKMPAVFADLYQDLRDRRLLPLVALILVAIVAVPFVLGGGAEEEEPVSPATPPVEAGASAANASLAVVPANPGLRDYRKRLRHRSSDDPFRPQYTGPVLEGTQLGGSPETSTTPTTTSEESSGSPSASSPAAPPSSGATGAPPSAPPGDGGSDGAGDQGGTPPQDELTFYTFAIDVKITKTTTLPNGRKSKPEVIEKDRVLPPATLPGAKTEVITYIGVSPKTGKALFIVSEDVGSVFGDVECVAGSGRCQLLELEKGLPVTFLYGENDTRYKVNVLDVATVAAPKGEKPTEEGKP
jgi:hypothetical protein